MREVTFKYAFELIKERENWPRISNYILCRLNGFYHKIKFKLFRKRVRSGKNFKVRGKIRIKGPGLVIIDDEVHIDGRGYPVTPYTYSKDAVIKIGSHSFLNSTRFGCQVQIQIGPFAILGDAHILDTDFHSIEINRWSEEARVLHSPVKIGQNVWIAGKSIVLKGVTIGNNSVIGPASVVTDDIPPNCLAAGNPARVIKELI